MKDKYLNIVMERSSSLPETIQHTLRPFFDIATFQELPRVCIASANALLYQGRSSIESLSLNDLVREKEQKEIQCWLALSAWGFHLNGEIDFARYFAVLARESDFLKTELGEKVTTSNQVDLRVFESLLGLGITDIGHTVPDEITLNLYEEGFVSLFQNDWYAVLTESIPNHSNQVTGLALTEIAKSWLQTQSVEEFHPIDQPSFEPIPCALAALAFDQGFMPELLPEEVRHFYALSFLQVPENLTLSYII